MNENRMSKRNIAAINTDVRMRRQQQFIKKGFV